MYELPAAYNGRTGPTKAHSLFCIYTQLQLILQNSTVKIQKFPIHKVIDTVVSLDHIYIYIYVALQCTVFF